MPKYRIETQEQHPDGWRTVGDPRLVDSPNSLYSAVDAVYDYLGNDWPAVGRAWRVAGWSDPDATGKPDARRECPYVRHETDNGGWVDTMATQRSSLRTGDSIVAGNTVYVVREPIRWELTGPQHWVWTRRADSPELTVEQLAELGGDRAFDGTGYGFLSEGPDHIYHRVVDPQGGGL